MPSGGVIIRIKNEDVIPLYLAFGVYGQKLRIGTDGEPNPETYLRALADHACVRGGDHLFFRCGGRFYYGGRVDGPTEHAAFVLNGPRGLLGKRAEAPLVWNESVWEALEPPAREGLDSAVRPPVCQPFLLRFRDWFHLRGRWIDEYRYYLALGDYNYLLPSTHDPSGMTSISPGETDVLLRLLSKEADGELDPPDDVPFNLRDEPTPYEPALGPKLEGARSRDGLIAAVLANPQKLPWWARPRGAGIARDVPISPYRRRNVETADIAYYSERRVREGTVPDRLFYLDTEPAGEQLSRRIKCQYQWLEQLLGDDIHEIAFVAGSHAGTSEFYQDLPDRLRASIKELKLSIDRTGL